ncbi:CT620/CT621 family type III secretion system effector [Chlamydia sp.]|uniref:CT620/CT621 family type III secretion system effector n=1 Tax=Chlamydia sp. TaxID=35827 RepID=UPI0025BC06BF|nr:CT620/CT621 family type III secretion system effector [Chlamydia sp.]MBQ8498884.1 hypothetical protein [Chlamydia sp.]
MNRINHTQGSSTDYNSTLEAIAKKLSQPDSTTILSQVTQYEQLKAEQEALKALLASFDQRADQQYRNLLKRLEQFEIERKTGRFSEDSRIQEKPISSTQAENQVIAQAVVDSSSATPIFTGIKQSWAARFVQGIHEVLDHILVEDALLTEEERGDLLAIRMDAASLRDKQERLSAEDLRWLFSLSKDVISVLQKASLPGTRQLELIQFLTNIFGSEESLAESFAKVRLDHFQEILSTVKELLTEEEFSIFQDVVDEISYIKHASEIFLSPEYIEAISRVGGYLSSKIVESGLKASYKVDLCQRIAAMYQEQVDAVQTYHNLEQEALSVYSWQHSHFAQVVSLVSSLMQSLSPVSDEERILLNPAMMVSILPTVRAIGISFNSLTKEQQQMINAAVSSLQDQNIDEYLGVLWAHLIIVNCRNDETRLLEGVEESFTEAWSGLSEEFVLTATMRKVLQTCSQQGSVTLTNGENYALFSYDASGREICDEMTLGESFHQILGTMVSVALSEANLFHKERDSFILRANSEKSSILKHITQKESKNQFLTKMQTDLNTGKTVVQTKGVEASPLPSAVASVLIDHYMPKEVLFLEAISARLYYGNFGSNIGNTILEAISSYVNSATYFGFANYIGQPPAAGKTGENIFAGSVDSAKEKLEEEKKQVDIFLKITTDAKTTVTNQQSLVTADTKLSAEQKKSITDELTRYTSILDAISTSLTSLKTHLAPLTIAAVSDVAGVFQVTNGINGTDGTNWRLVLQNLEDTVVSGEAGSAVNVGMFQMQALVHSNQQAYADMGQNFQLELQMHLTSMQQEWMVVATSLQLLNQIYLGLARNLIR